MGINAWGKHLGDLSNEEMKLDVNVKERNSFVSVALCYFLKSRWIFLHSIKHLFLI